MNQGQIKGPNKSIWEPGEEGRGSVTVIRRNLRAHAPECGDF